MGEKVVEDKVVSVRRDLTGRLVPEKGSVVAAVITKVNPRFASCRILTIGAVPLKESFNGVIRYDSALPFSAYAPPPPIH